MADDLLRRDINEAVDRYLARIGVGADTAASLSVARLRTDEEWRAVPADQWSQVVVDLRDPAWVNIKAAADHTSVHPQTMYRRAKRWPIAATVGASIYVCLPRAMTRDGSLPGENA